MLLDFFGWTESELLAALKSAQQDLANGTMIAGVGAGDINKSNQIQSLARERIQNLQRALYELDPDKYDLFEHAAANRSCPVFNSSSRAY